MAVFNEYRKAPGITKTRIYLETMNRVLPQMQHKVVIDQDLRSILPLLNLDKSAKGGEGR